MDIFHIKDIIEFYSEFDADVKRSTVEWRIYELKKLGVLYNVKRGKYALEQPQLYQPGIPENLKSAYDDIHMQFPHLQFCIWTTKYLNEFMIFQPMRFYHLIETEKEGTEAVFEYLMDKNYEVFLNPPEEILNRYASHHKESWIVNNLVSEAPVQTIREVPTITLEKMLVDIYSDKETFAAFQGNALHTIFQNAFRKYVIDESSLLRYASRRGKKEEIGEYIETLSLEHSAIYS